MQWLIQSLIISILLNLLMFIPAFLFKTDKLTDISYSLTFILLSLIMIFYKDVYIVSILIIFWALRLGIYLLIRIIKIKKDKRFDNIRNSPLKFLGFWFLQGISVWLISVPLLLLNNNNVSYFGIFIWVIGLLIETIADYQKFKFILNKNKNWISSGFWKYSRHPNYFGEILCWIGIYVTVLPGLNLLNSFIALISPIYIIVLLLYVSGIPILEKKSFKKWGHLKEYNDYLKKTNLLIPWFNKKN
jgi:steroid 5-alpha reductase family enzyme